MARAVRWILVLLICTGLASCSDEILPPVDSGAGGKVITQSDLSNAANAFGFNLFKEIAKVNPDSNIVISPVSISLSLGMTQNGAAGATLDSMLSTLELSGYTVEGANECYRSLIDLLMTLDPEVQCQIANSIWYHWAYTLKEGFHRTCRSYFDSEVRSLNFASWDAPDIINRWVEEYTNGLITDMVDKPMNPYQVISLINAIYFRGSWTHPFNPEYTRKDWFIRRDGPPTPCRMMYQPESHYYTAYEGPGFYGVGLAYGDSLFSMTILLPKEGIPVGSVIEELNQKNWEDWIGGFAPWRGALYMPKFEIEFGDSLEDYLTALGMGIAFDSYRAEFPYLFDDPDPIWLCHVNHKAYIRVDERGTEAAAATDTGGETGIPPMIVIDRPFVFFIRENRSNTVLFIGQVVDPGYDLSD